MDFESLPFDQQIDTMLGSIQSDMGSKSNLAKSAASYREHLTQPFSHYKFELTKCMNELEDGSGIVTESFSIFTSHLQPPPGI